MQTAGEARTILAELADLEAVLALTHHDTLGVEIVRRAAQEIERTRSAGQALYAALNTMPKTCLTQGWPFRKQELVDGKLVDAPDVHSRSCIALRGWESIRGPVIP